MMPKKRKEDKPYQALLLFLLREDQLELLSEVTPAILMVRDKASKQIAAVLALGHDALRYATALLERTGLRCISAELVKRSSTNAPS
jgi:hypothetical protein